MFPLLRYTLDLFESNQPVAQTEQAQGTIKNGVNSKPGVSRAMPPAVAAEPAPVQTPGLDATHFKHPQANREMCLGDAVVAYRFVRGQRRTIGFSVGPDGLAVRAPKWVPLYEVDAALQAKAAWILRKLQETRERHTKLTEQVIDWRDGACMPYLGQSVVIRLAPEHRFGAGGAELLALPGEPPTLHLSLPHNASPAQIRDRVQAWLMRQARQVFQQRLDFFAPLLGVQWKKLALSNAGTRWGSARVDGSIRLNWRLVHMRMSVLDYVVAHELSHLRVMDHSPRFWDTVRAVVPDFAALRQQLKTEAVPRWDV